MASTQTGQPDSTPVAILGAGVSGRGVTALCARLGREAVIFDEVMPGARRDFAAATAAEFGTVVVSPGFSPMHPWRRALDSALEDGMLAADAVYGELGFAIAAWPGKVLGVTGTNGKTTATGLLHAVVAAEVSPAQVLLAGNIGISASAVVAEAETAGAGDWLVCEISSFQADIPRGIQLDGLAWTNFAIDHIDYHGSESAYFRAKATLFACLRPGAPAVIGDGVVAAARRLGHAVPGGVEICPDAADAAADSESGPPPGSPFAWGPQRMNYGKVRRLVAALGFREEALREQAAALKLPAHRLAEVAEIGGVSFWNDSKATNPDAALAALRSFDEPCVWIAGGRDKACDLDAFAAEAGRLLDGVAVTYGSVGETFAKKLRALGCETVFHSRFVDAVAAAAGLARERGIARVVLSPGFASFDQFGSYADRGNSFISEVLSLKG